MPRIDLSRFSIDDCIKEAYARTRIVIEHVIDVINLHEANEFVLFTTSLSRQIPKSYAAHAFNDFRRALHSLEVIRLCALWDNEDMDKNNLTTVIAFTSKEGVVERIGDLKKEVHFLNPSDDPGLRAIEEEESRWAKERNA